MMNKKEVAARPMTWGDLCGERILMAIRTDVNHPFDPAANGVVLDLDDLVVFAFEDPSDGYRSLCATPLIASAHLYSYGCSSDYIRAPVIVRTWGNVGGPDGIELLDRRNGKTILRLGTDNADDYYPRFVCEWQPQNLAENTP
jgi:hypothetical protein